MSDREKRRLGKGALALFPEASEERVEPATTEVKREESIDASVLSRALDIVSAGKPVTSVWSRPIKVVLRYLFLTQPGFRESVEAQKMLEEGLKAKYPELWKRVEEALA